MGTERNVLSRFLVHCISLVYPGKPGTERERHNMSQAEPGTHGRDVAVAPPQWAWAGLDETRKAGRKRRFELPCSSLGKAQHPQASRREGAGPATCSKPGGRRGLDDGPVRNRDPSFPILSLRRQADDAPMPSQAVEVLHCP